jgi:hypothetical protein
MNGNYIIEYLPEPLLILKLDQDKANAITQSSWNPDGAEYLTPLAVN